MMFCFGSFRNRFVSTWNSIALLIFFGDIFFDVKVFGYEGLAVAIFMWIVGGIVATVIFGPKSSKSRRRRSSRSRVTQKPAEARSVQYCTACGTSYDVKSQFCPECGTTSLEATQSVGNLKKAMRIFII